MKEFEIRRLIENYYDIQKIRVETFNRIVCWAKENKERIKEILSHTKTESHSLDASHCQFGTQFRDASHNSVETHLSNALKLLENKKYAEFVKRFVLSHNLVETQSENASHQVNEPQKSYASQPMFGIQLSNAFSNLIKEVEDLIWFHNKLYETEKELYRRIDNWSKYHPLRKEFLNHVKGIGAIFSSGIIAWLSKPILKANYVSQIWSYCGLTPNQERKRGKKLNYNPRLKTFCWKIGQSFIKYKCFGRKLYDAFRKECETKHPDWSKLHCHNWARRKVVKLFIASVWEVWRKMNNLPITKPYPIEILGHKDLITPVRWIEK